MRPDLQKPFWLAIPYGLGQSYQIQCAWYFGVLARLGAVFRGRSANVEVGEEDEEERQQKSHFP